MTPALLLFEDPAWRSLRPLTDMLPVPALAFGASTLGDRLAAAAGAATFALAGRADVVAAWAARPESAAGGASGDDVLAILGAALPGPWLDAIARAPAGTRGAWLARGRLIAARLPAAELAPHREAGEQLGECLAALALPAHEVDARVVDHPWQLIEWNAEALAADLAKSTGVAGAVHEAAVLLAPGRVSIGSGARIDPFAVIDAREGPVAIGPRAVIRPHTHVIGPCAIGEGTQILGGVVGGSTIGPECRLAGEIEASIWQGFANKRHHGFVGHSVIGEWVNLGALTTTSDLKNNYGPVRVWIDGREIDSGNPKVGAIVGAHVKTGIGTLLPTGATVGVGANLFGGGRFAAKPVASFAWWDGEHSSVHDLEKFLATSRTAMGRRGRVLGAEEERMLRALFTSTAAERGALVS